MNKNIFDSSVISEDIKKLVKEVSIGDGITSIGSNTFQFCRNLEKVEIPDSVEEILDYAFDLTNLEEVTIPNSVKQISELAFERACNSFNKVVIKIFEDNPNKSYINQSVLQRNCCEVQIIKRT